MNMAARQRPSMLVIAVLVICSVGILEALWSRSTALKAYDEVLRQRYEAERALQHSSLPDFDQNGTAANERVRLLSIKFHTPWVEMIDSLQIAAKDIRVIQIQPQADGARLLVTGKANNGRAFFEYMTRLRDSSHWQMVEPLDESLDQAGNGKIEFRMSVAWRDADAISKN